MRLPGICLLAFIISLNTAAQDSNVVINREAYKVKLAVDKKTSYESEIKVTPYFVQDQVLQLYPGEDILLEAELDNGKIKSVKVVKENLHPEKTITISFSQLVEKKMHDMMMMKLTNPFKQQLIYKARILLFKSNKWASTTTVPIMPGISSFETWPDIITSIALLDWSLQGE
jgi:glycine cleavage system H lipoate-binding protein